jgi:hypothetical protein
VKHLKSLFFVLAAAAVTILFIGYVQPAEAMTRVQALFRKPVPEIWATVMDFEHWASWNPEVKSVARSGNRNLHPTWALQTSSGLRTMEITEVELNKQIQTLIEKGSTQTRWTWGFREVPAGTELTITQKKIEKNLFLRGLQVFQGEAERIELVLVGLGNRHELRVEPKSGDAVKSR